MSKETIQLPFTFSNSAYARQVVEDIILAGKQDGSLLDQDGTPTLEALTEALGQPISVTDREELVHVYGLFGNSEITVGFKWLVTSKYFRHIHDGQVYTKEPTEVDWQTLTKAQQDAMNANPLLVIHVVGLPPENDTIS